MRKLCAVGLTLFLLLVTSSGEDAPAPPVAKADEPLAKAFSLPRAAGFLDSVTLGWIREHKCAACHTGYPYLLARTSVDPKAEGVAEVRKFFEGRVTAWDVGGKGKGYLKAEGVIEFTEGWTEVVAIASTLAMHDNQTTGKLHPATKTALARMWELQKEAGHWDWNKEELAPLEYDDYYGAVYAALGVGHAPEGYAKSEAAKEGVARLRKYFAKTPAPDLHHRIYLLWAAQKLDGLMTLVERNKTATDIQALQREDGGWSLPSLGSWKRHNGQPQDEKVPSDGYATGLAVYVLRQNGLEADTRPIQRGVAWLKANQRESGRWFTRSLNRDGRHYLSNTGTAFAILALRSVE